MANLLFRTCSSQFLFCFSYSRTDVQRVHYHHQNSTHLPRRKYTQQRLLHSRCRLATLSSHITKGSLTIEKWYLAPIVVMASRLSLIQPLVTQALSLSLSPSLSLSLSLLASRKLHSHLCIGFYHPLSPGNLSALTQLLTPTNKQTNKQTIIYIPELYPL